MIKLLKYFSLYDAIFVLFCLGMLVFVAYDGIYIALLNSDIGRAIVNSFCFILLSIYSYFSLKKLLEQEKTNKIMAKVKKDKND
jgi:arginine exporter protein ArgO